MNDPNLNNDDLTKNKRLRSVAARFNWHVTYTLLHNPDIRVMRKGYIQQLRQARQLGVHIPISDRQADIDFTLLAGNIAEAKEKMNPSSKKDKDKEERGLEEVVEGGGVVKGVRALALSVIRPTKGEGKEEEEDKREEIERSEVARSDHANWLSTAETVTTREGGGEEEVHIEEKAP